MNSKNTNSTCQTFDKSSWLCVHPDLLATKELVYDPIKFKYSQPVIETESKEYGGYTFELNGLSIRFRVAKITPTKIGHFVTLWKRIGNGPIQPYDLSDIVDFFVISTRKDNYFGQFVFPKSILCDQDIVSKMKKGGKRAMRVYQSWEKPTSKQAQKTQAWQLKYFLEIPKNQSLDFSLARKLYKIPL